MDEPSKYDLFVAEGVGLSNDLKQKRTALQQNSDLTPQARQRKIDELGKEFESKIADLQKRYGEQYNKDAARLDKAQNGGPKPPSFAERIKAKARHKTSVLDSDYIGSEVEAAAVIESNEALARALERSTTMNLLSRLDNDNFTKAMDAAHGAGDMTRLEHFRDVAFIRGDHLNVQKASGYLNEIKESSLTYEQRLYGVHKQRLDTHKELFNWGIKKISQGGEFQDLRGGETDQGLDMQIELIKSKYGNGNQE